MGAVHTGATALGTSFSGTMTTIGTSSTTTAATIATAFNSIVAAAKQMASGVQSGINSLPSTVASVFSSLASSMTSKFAQAASNVQSQVSSIKSSLASIPRSISVSVSAQKAFSFGGVVDKETDAKIGEDGREYVIPVTKPQRAIALIRSAASELGMTVQSTREAAAALGGAADRNITPSYATNSSTNTTTTNNTTINAPANIVVHGTDAKSTADNVARNQERIVLRNIKSALA